MQNENNVNELENKEISEKLDNVTGGEIGIKYETIIKPGVAPIKPAIIMPEHHIQRVSRTTSTKIHCLGKAPADKMGYCTYNLKGTLPDCLKCEFN